MGEDTDMGFTDDEIRRMLRKAAKGVLDEKVRKELEKEGITLGEPIRMDGPEFLAKLEKEADHDEDSPWVEVVLYGDDTLHETRETIEDALVESLRECRLGRWLSSGWKEGEKEPFANIDFVVTDREEAIELLRSRLIELGVGRNTEIRDGERTLRVYDQDC